MMPSHSLDTNPHEVKSLPGIPESGAVQQEETPDKDDGEGNEDSALGNSVHQLLTSVVPCRGVYQVALVRSTERQRIQSAGDKWTPVSGLRLVLKLAEADDCVLIVSNCMLIPESDREESHWAIYRGSCAVSPSFATHSRQKTWNHNVCLAWMDQPGTPGEYEFHVATNVGSFNSRFAVSPERQHRHLLAVVFPACQGSWVEDDEPQVVEPGTWRDVEGLYEVVTTLPGDRVLVICTLSYIASWASEQNRGRFTINRDEHGLDGPHTRGLQSVRALGPNLPRVALMATVDQPQPGPHVYQARAAVTAGCTTGVTAVLRGGRQLALVRLPAGIVVGPNLSQGPVTIDEERWSELPGLEVVVMLQRPRDRVMIIYHTDCCPQDYHYKSHFTVFRRSGTSGKTCNLGFSEDFGLEMVCSDYAASSEFPVGIFCDVPGGVGMHTYSVCARADKTGTSSNSPSVTVGYSGSITAVLLSSR